MTKIETGESSWRVMAIWMHFIVRRHRVCIKNHFQYSVISVYYRTYNMRRCNISFSCFNRLMTLRFCYPILITFNTFTVYLTINEQDMFIS